jgi:hypothetical protein
MIRLTPGCALLSNLVTSGHSLCEKLENLSLYPFWDRPRILFVRHSFSNSEVLCLLSHVMVVNVEDRMLPQFWLSRNL